MGFLDKINAAKNTAAAAEKKVNPLLLKRTPAAAAPAPEEEKAVANGPVPAAAAPAAPAKVNPLMRKAAPATPAVTTEAAPAEPAAAPAEKPTSLLLKNKAADAKTEEKVEPKVEETPVEANEVAPVEEVEVEEVEVEEVVPAEQTPAPAEVPAETETETKAAVKGKGKGGGKKVEAKAQATDVAVAAAAEDVTEMPESTIGFTEMAEAMSSPMIDEEWTTFRDNIEAELDAIVIDMDMNPGTLKVVLSELNAIYDQIAQPLHQARTLLENLTNKEDGAIQVIKSVNTGSGNNDMERKKAGYIAVMNYKPRNGGSINLFDAAAEARSRYNFLKGIYDRIQYKNNMLITMNGALKLERDFTAAS